MNPKRQSKTSSVPARPVPARTDLSGWRPGHPGGDENGFIIIAVIALIAILALVGTVGVLTTSTELKISSNYKTGVQAFHAAQAGLEEARARLRANAGDVINDNDPTDTDWRAYIGSLSNAQDKGYDSVTFPTLHTLYGSIQADLDYTVVIRHATDATNQILYWGDDDEDGILTRSTSNNHGNNIYVVTCYSSSVGSNKTVEAEMTRLPPVFAPGAIYVESQTDVNGSSSYIYGNDYCGTDDKPAVATTLPDAPVGSPPKPPVNEAGGPTITGTPDIQYDTTSISLDWLVNYFEGSANFIYDVTDTGSSGNLSPGSVWGTPTGGSQGPTPAPSSCGSSNIIYINTTGMTGNETKLSGGVTGCGVLLVDGNIEVNGGFSWYGIIIATGNIKFTGGGGGGKLITGAILTKGSANTDVAGSVTIIYCSDAIEDQTVNQPLIYLNWREL